MDNEREAGTCLCPFPSLAERRLSHILYVNSVHYLEEKCKGVWEDYFFNREKGRENLWAGFPLAQGVAKIDLLRK